MEYTLVHIICHYYVFQHIMITVRRRQASDVQQQQHILLARILVHPSLKIRQQTVLYLDSIPLAIIILIHINTYYYVLLRIFLQKCCFMMSFVVFTNYDVLILVFTYYGPPRKRFASQGLATQFRGGL